jgi:hypothetical protein
MRQRIFVLFVGLPRVMLVGLLILVIGGTLDLLYHAAPPRWTMQLCRYLGADGVGAHLVTLFGKGGAAANDASRLSDKEKK